MNKRPTRWVGVAVPLALALSVAGAAPALGHEGRTAGGVAFVVGWGDEPAYTGFRNSVQVTVSEANGGGPVTDVGDSLKVEVTKGSDKVTLPLQANFGAGASGTPGDYRAWLTPTRPGTYTFRLIGTVRGQSVDETFTSSGATFDDVEEGADIQFPAKDPSPGQLATRIDRELPRLEGRTETVEAGLRAAVDRAASARTLAIAAAVAGVSSLAVAGAALVAGARRGARNGSEPEAGGSDARAGQAGPLRR